MSDDRILQVTLTHYPDADLPWQAKLIGDDFPLVLISVERESDARKLMLAALDLIWPDEMPERPPVQFFYADPSRPWISRDQPCGGAQGAP